MFRLEPLESMTDEERYKYMLILLKGQLSSEKDNLANISNATGIIMASMDKLNWAGFYILRGEELVLGPFQGLPACNRIKADKGVCGTAVVEKKVQRVPDVAKFPGHIACDSASQSELVVPIIKDEKVYGVLDLDSPEKNRFTKLEEKYVSEFVKELNKYVNWKNL